MSLPVKLSDIKMEVLPEYHGGYDVQVMLPGEIPGATVYCHHFPKEYDICFEGQRDFIRIFFLCDGDTVFEAENESFHYAEKAVFVAKPESRVRIHTEKESVVLEIRWELNEQDLADLDAGETHFPISEAYRDALQYRDFFKSETTISRAILKQSVIPRFAMGSVEAKGDDLVGQHAHPLLDQFFFSFPENAGRT